MFSIIGSESDIFHVFIDVVLFFLFFSIFCFNSVSSTFLLLSNMPSIFFDVLRVDYDGVCYNLVSNSSSSYSSSDLRYLSIETRDPDSSCRFEALNLLFFKLWLITVCIWSIWRATSIFFVLRIIFCLLSSYSWSAFWIGGAISKLSQCLKIWLNCVFF